MPNERVERRLTAILAADVAGYRGLTGMDEEGTHAQLKEHGCPRRSQNHRIPGRVVKNTGDGFLAELGSVVNAVRAVDIQDAIADRNNVIPQEKRIELRNVI